MSHSFPCIASAPMCFIVVVHIFTHIQNSGCQSMDVFVSSVQIKVIIGVKFRAEREREIYLKWLHMGCVASIHSFDITSCVRAASTHSIYIIHSAQRNLRWVFFSISFSLSQKTIIFCVFQMFIKIKRELAVFPSPFCQSVLSPTRSPIDSLTWC